MTGQFPTVKDPARFFRAQTDDQPAARTRATAGDPHNFLGDRMAQLAETDEDDDGTDAALAAADAPDDVDQDDVADEDEDQDVQFDGDEEESPPPRERRQAEPEAEEDEAEAEFDARQTPEYQELLRQRRQEADAYRRQRSEQINRDMEQADRMKVARRGQLFQALPNLDQQQAAQLLASELRLSDAEILHWKNVAYDALSHIDRTERLAALQERAGFTEAELQELTAVPDDQIETHAERLLARRASQAGANPEVLRRLEKLERENKALKARSGKRHVVGGGTGARPRGRPAPDGSNEQLLELLGFTQPRR
jgi:hypothetical protein